MCQRDAVVKIKFILKVNRPFPGLFFFVRLLISATDRLILSRKEHTNFQGWRLWEGYLRAIYFICICLYHPASSLLLAAAMYFLGPRVAAQVDAPRDFGNPLVFQMPWTLWEALHYLNRRYLNNGFCGPFFYERKPARVFFSVVDCVDALRLNS
jgi:hypothetical protein